MMSYPKMLNDGLCKAAITMQARQLLGTVCVLGGAQCPLIDSAEARQVLDQVKRDPSVTVQLVSDADEIPHYETLTAHDYAKLDKQAVFNRKRDLDVLQRLGLAPGDTRRSRYIYTLLLGRIETPDGICAYDTPGWEGCPVARSGAYESVRAKGWQAAVYDRSADEKAEARRRNVERIRNDARLFIRPHHFMCLSCWYGPTEGKAARTNDTLDEVYQRIRRDPEVEITLVEGNCEACHCCDGFHPESTRCVHAGGLIRDYKKDLDCFQKLGLMPGATLKARDLFKLLYEKIPTTTDVCGYGDGVVTSEEWRVCSGPEGNSGYVRARETLKF